MKTKIIAACLAALLTTNARADEPSTLQRRADVEAALLQRDAALRPSSGLLGFSLVSIIVGTVLAGIGTGMAIDDGARTVTWLAIAPYAAVGGRSLNAPQSSHPEVPLIAAAVAAGISVVSLLVGLAIRPSDATTKSLLLERARLDGELRAERRALLRTSPAVEEVVESPPLEESAPVIRKPLVPR